VAVGLEWTHAQLLSQGEGVPVGIFCLLTLRRVVRSRDGAEESQAPRLDSPLLAVTGEGEGTYGMRGRSLQTPSQEIDLTDPGECQRRALDPLGKGDLGQGLGKQREGYGDLPGESLRSTQGRGTFNMPVWDTPDPAEFEATVKAHHGLMDIAFAEVDTPETQTGLDKEDLIALCLGALDSIFSPGETLSEHTLFGKGEYQPTAAGHPMVGHRWHRRCGGELHLAFESYDALP